MKKYKKEEIMRLLELAGLIVPLDGVHYLINKGLQGLIKTERMGKCKDYPNEFNGLSDNIIYRKVMEQAKVPQQYDKDIKYFLKTESKGAIKAMKEILKRPDINYKKFIRSVNGYYNGDIPPMAFAKFIESGTWENAYDNVKAPSKYKPLDEKGVL